MQDDLISRQAVLDTISELNAISFYEAQEDSKECYYEIRQAVENMPPVTPQQKYGKWIAGINWKCNNCGFVDSGAHGFNYCPNCGAKMVEPQESEDKE